MFYILLRSFSDYRFDIEHQTLDIESLSYSENCLVGAGIQLLCQPWLLNFVIDIETKNGQGAEFANNVYRILGLSYYVIISDALASWRTL